MTKKRKPKFKVGDFVQNIEDPSIIVIVTRNTDPGTTTFHGTCIAASKRKVGEHERFWLRDNFQLTKIKIETL